MKILRNGKEVFEVNLGVVKIGESKEYEFMLENEIKWDVMDVEVSLTQVNEKEQEVEVKEVKILECPKEIKAYKSALLKLSWTPSIEIKSGLKAKFKIKCLEIWR